MLSKHTEAPMNTIALTLGLSSEMGLSSRVLLEKRHGQNLILFSESRTMRQRHLRSILESLRLQRVETVFVDAAAGQGTLVSRRTNQTALETERLPELLASLRSGYEHPNPDAAAVQPEKALLIHAPQNLKDLRCDPIQAIGSPSGNATASDFEWLLRHGPSVGLHCIILTERPGQFMYAIDPRSRLLELFDIRIATRMGEDEARKVMPDASAGHLGETNALLYLRNENKCIRYRPFEWVED